MEEADSLFPSLFSCVQHKHKSTHEFYLSANMEEAD